MMSHYTVLVTMETIDNIKKHQVLFVTSTVKYFSHCLNTTKLRYFCLILTHISTDILQYMDDYQTIRAWAEEGKMSRYT